MSCDTAALSSITAAASLSEPDMHSGSGAGGGGTLRSSVVGGNFGANKNYHGKESSASDDNDDRGGDGIINLCDDDEADEEDDDPSPALGACPSASRRQTGEIPGEAVQIVYRYLSTLLQIHM